MFLRLVDGSLQSQIEHFKEPGPFHANEDEQREALGIRLVGRHKRMVDLSIPTARIPGRHE